MIKSNDCWLKNRCYKYLNNPEAQCRTEDCFCPKLFKINDIMDKALLTESQKKRVQLIVDEDPMYDDSEAFDKLVNIEHNITSFVNSGRNLFIYSSNVGNGKTSWAIRLIQDYIEAIWPESELTCRALFINIPRFFLALKDSISNQSDYIDHIKKNVLDADLVVWDEVATKSLTPFEFENLLSLIDSRINSGKSNIYTSNLFGEEMESRIGDRLYSRIVNLSTPIQFKGRDKRSMMEGDDNNGTASSN